MQVFPPCCDGFWMWSTWGSLRDGRKISSTFPVERCGASPSRRILLALETSLTSRMWWAQCSGTSKVQATSSLQSLLLWEHFPGSPEQCPPPPRCKKSDTLRLPCWRVDAPVEGWGGALPSSSLPRCHTREGHHLGPSDCLLLQLNIPVSLSTSRTGALPR